MRTITIACSICCSLLLAATERTTSLVQLIELGQIELKPTGLGGHSGNCLKVDVQNRSAQAIRTSIPAGWRFVSENSGIQDLIVVREEAIALGPKGRATVTCRAFCCEASQAGPQPGEVYRKGQPAGGKLVELARLVDKGRYDDGVVQNAVWVLSDGNDIGSVGAVDGSANDTLRHLLSELSGQPVPLYTLTYAPDGTRACSQRPATISRVLRMENGAALHLTVIVRSDDGRIHRILHEQTPIPAGGVNVPLTVEVLDWPEGRYAFHVYTTEANGAQRLPFTL